MALVVCIAGSVRAYWVSSQLEPPSSSVKHIYKGKKNA